MERKTVPFILKGQYMEECFSLVKRGLEMSQQTSEHVALITGANKGIGFETARQLGTQGITVLVGSRN